MKSFSKIRNVLLVVIAGAFLLSQSPLLEQAIASSRNIGSVRPDHYIVVLKDDVKSVPDVASQVAHDHGLVLDHIYSSSLHGFSARVSLSRLDKLKNDPRVKFVNVDRVVNIDPAGGRKPRITPTPTPTPAPLWITITKPNGGETLQVGQTYRITWSASSKIDTVSIGYKSCDSCLDWIAFSTPNLGYYDWNVDVGSTVNTQFKIEITGYQTGVGSVTDLSDNFFTVLQPVTPTPTPTLVPTVTPTPMPTATPAPTATPTPVQTIPTGIARIGRNSTNKGTGVGVAIIDTGIDLTHPDLAGNIVADTSCVNGVPSGNDDNGHGTHVSGTIAALDNNIGVVGVAPEAKLVAVKVLSASGSGYWSDVICGIDWVTAHQATYNIKVANMSLGGGSTGSDNNCGNTNNDAMHQAICASTAAGVTYVVAAGNSGTDASSFVPAAYDDTVITVSALSDSDGKPGGVGSYDPSFGYPDDTFAAFSNYGSMVDLGAPGVSIYSTLNHGNYGTHSGTSMASPHVAGSAALYIATHPTALWSQVRDALVQSGEPLGSGHTDPSGHHPEPVVNASQL